MNTDRYRLIFSVGLLLVTFLFAGCEHARVSSAGMQQDQARMTKEMRLQEQRANVVYGTPGTDVIRVYINGTEAKRRGLYYFKSGTTLEEALTIAGNPVYTEFARCVLVSNLASDKKRAKSYWIRKLSASEKKNVLRDNDCLIFPCGFI